MLTWMCRLTSVLGASGHPRIGCLTSAIDPKQTYIVCCFFDQCLPPIAVPRSFMALGEGFSVNCAKLGEGRVRQREFGRRQILVQVGDRRGAGDQKNVGCTMQQPGKRHLH